MITFVRVYLPNGNKIKVESNKFEVVNGNLQITDLNTGKLAFIITQGNWFRCETQAAVTEDEPP